MQCRADVWGSRSCKHALPLQDRSATLAGFRAALPRVASHAPVLQRSGGPGRGSGPTALPGWGQL